MNKLSITAKITIWYTVFLAVIAAALIVVLVQAQYLQEQTAAERLLVETLADVSEMIEDDGNDFIYDKSIDFYQKGIYISVYDESGELLVGRRPASFAEFPELADKTTVNVRDNLDAEWFVYDSLFQSGDDPVWIRGMMHQSASESKASATLHYLIILLPVFLLLVILGGWVITRRAFQPLRNIIRTTDEIRADRDMSRRIPQGGNHDELFELTGSINGMFERIQDAFEREKQFASDVSHELRTPIAVIQSQSEYALGDPSYSETALRVINTQAKQMNNLVTKLLMLSRSDAGTLPLEMEDIDLSALLSDIAEQQQIIAEGQGIELTADIPRGIHVVADESMLIRIILNLISNAMKYGRTPEDSIARIRITLKVENGFARCTVSDEGPGIPAEKQAKVWDRFYQIDSSHHSGEPGEPSAGLGLSMVQALTGAMGGTASLQSKEGHGAAFTVQFRTVKEREA